MRRYIDGTAPMNRLLGYAKGFSKLGIDVWFYFLITNNKEEKANIEDPNIHFVYLWENNNRFFKKNRALGLFKNLLSVRKCIKKDDILFIYGRANYMYVMARSVKHRSKIFCEITEHPEYQGYGLLKRISICFSLYHIKRLDGLFVISQTLREYFISKGVNKEKICVINIFVDGDRFNIDKTNDVNKYIAYCGSVSKIKDGVDVLIRSFALFHLKHPNYFLYIIGGKGDDEPLSYFEHLANELGVQKTVVFTGKVSANKLPELLVNSQILALARPDSLQARNGFPTKLGEYLATGNPVLVTNVGEIPIFIKHRVNGFISKESNVDDFASQLCWIVENEAQAKLIGLRGKELVDNEFSFIIQSKKAYDFIETTINNNMNNKND